MNNLPNSDRHIQIQRDAIGSAIVSGEGNKVFIYQYQYHVAQAETPNFDVASTSRKLAPNPYRGLLAFEESDGDRFFGREKQTEQLWKKLRELYEEVAAIRLLPVYGPSGSGKSSLVRAGLIPELARRPLPGRNQVRVAILVPGAHPLEALAGVLASIATNDLTPVAKTREFAGELSQTNKVGEYDGLRRIADVLPESHTAPLIVLIDQFEEVYTLCQDQTERDAFVGNLLYAVSDRSRRVSVVVTLRSDLLGETQKHPVLNRLFSSQGFLVPAMSEEELCEAIRKPAEFAEHPLDEATIQLLLEQAEGREGALPLLQFALTRIWEGIGEGVAPAVTLERIGGVGGALAGEAQRVFDSLSSKEQVIARRVFLGLVQLGEGTRDTRRRTVIDNLASYKDDDAQVRRVVERFSDPGVRLITLGSDENGQETVEVSHEALFNHWQLLDRWLEESRSALRFQRRLEEVVQNWEQRSRPRGNLWRSPDLDLLRRYVQQWGDSLTPAQLKFFQASVSAERQSKVLQWVAVSSLITLTGLALWQTWTARRGEQRSFAQQLAAQAESMNNRNAGLYQTSALLAVEAKNRLTQLGESSLEVDRVLRNVVLLLPRPLVKFSHDAEVVAASFSPDGSKVIAGSWDKTARIWDSVSEKELARLNHDAEVVAARFSPDGSKVITGSYDKTARIWDSVSGKELARLNHGEEVDTVGFSPNGSKVITGSRDKTARIWDSVSGKELARLNHGEEVDTVGFSPNGSKVITGSRDKTARIWDTSTGKELARLEHGEGVEVVSFSPNGSKVITGSRDKTARIWDTNTGKELARLEHDEGLEAISFSLSGSKVITGSYDSTARIWDTNTGKELTRLNHDNAVRVVSFSPDGSKVITGSRDKTARIWDTNTGKELARLNHDGRVEAVSFSPNGAKVITGSNDKTVRIWDSAGGKEFARLNHTDWVRAASFSPDGSKVITGSYDKTARIWDSAGGKELARLNHNERVEAVSFSPDGSKVITGSRDKTARIWDTSTGKELAQLEHGEGVEVVNFNLNGSKVITGSRGKTARIWDTSTGKELARLEHAAWVRAASFSPDGSKVITGSYDKTARIWDSAGGKELARLNHDERVEAVSFSPDSRKVITGSYDKTARIWDTSTGKELARLEHGEGVEVVNFNLNGSKVITGSRDKTARIWDMSTGKELIRFNHDDVVRAASFSPDGSKVITGSYDKTARIWDMSTGKELARLEHGQGVEVVSFSPDSRKVITGSYDKTAQIWPVSSKNLINEVCSRITRNLTAEEWISYLNSDVSQYGLVCKNLPVHPSVLIAGQNAVIQDDVARGIAIFNRAKLLQPDLDLDPTTLEIDRDPQKTARAVAASEKIERGSEYAKSGKVDEAIQLYQETQKTIDISADQWNSLCWFGSLHRRATDVMFACDKAVTLNPSSKWIRKSRGVAKALTGNVPVAIEDLQIFVNSLDPSAQAKASEKQWIEQLRSGQSPFTDDLLQNLLKE